jgi:hypothetical protein
MIRSAFAGYRPIAYRSQITQIYKFEVQIASPPALKLPDCKVTQLQILAP